MSVWFLFDQTTDEQKQVDEKSIRDSIRSLTLEKIPFIHCWQEGWADWKPLEQIPELMSMRAVRPPPPPKKVTAPPATPKVVPREEPKPVASKAEAAPAAAVHLEVLKAPTPAPAEKPAESFVNRRKAVRHQARFRIMLVCEDLVFRTFSKDISTNGFLLEQPVPPSMLGKKIECYISSPTMKSSLCFKTQLVQGQKELLRFQLTDVNPTSVKVLEEWLTTQKTSKAA